MWEGLGSPVYRSIFRITKRTDDFLRTFLSRSEWFESPIQLIALFVCLSGTAYGQYDNSDNLILAEEPIQMGGGYDSTVGTNHARCIEFTLSPEEPRFPGSGRNQDVSFDKTSMLRNFYGYATLGFDWFSTHTEITSTSEFNEYSANLYEYVQSGLMWSSIDSARLNDEYLEILKTDPDEFKRRCGDKYIGAVASTSEFLGTLSIKTGSRLDKDSLMLAAKGGGFGGVVEAAAKVELEKYLEQYQGILVLKSIGGGPFQTEMPAIGESASVKLNALSKMADEFDNLTFEYGGVPRFAALRSYDYLPNWPLDLPLNQGFTNPILERLKIIYWPYYDLLDRIDYIVQNSQEFDFRGDHSIEGLVDLRGKAQSYLELIDTALQRCKSSHGENCKFPENIPEVSTLSEKLPHRFVGACPKEVSLRIPNLEIQQLPRKNDAADTEMEGNNPTITIKSTLWFDDNALYLETIVNMKEGKKDWTEFEGDKVITLLNLEEKYPGCVLANLVNPNAPASIPDIGEERVSSKIVGKDVHGERPYYWLGNFVNFARCTADTKGDDKDDLGCKEIQYQNIKIFLEHVELLTPILPISGENSKKSKMPHGQLADRLEQKELLDNLKNSQVMDVLDGDRKSVSMMHEYLQRQAKYVFENFSTLPLGEWEIIQSYNVDDSSRFILKHAERKEISEHTSRDVDLNHPPSSNPSYFDELTIEENQVKDTNILERLNRKK